MKGNFKTLKHRFDRFIPYLMVNLLWGLGSCGLTPATPILKETPTTALNLAQQEALNTPAFIENDWPEEEWWKRFGDPQLDQLICMALADNPTVIGAEARLRAAMAIADKAHAPMFPTLDFQADITKIHQSENGIFGILRASDPSYPITYLQRNIGVSFGYEFDFFKKHANEMHAAMDELQALAAETYLVRLTLSMAVCEAYFQMNVTKARELLAEEFYRNRQEIISLMQQRHRKGLETEWTVNRALTSALSAKQVLDQTSHDVVIAQNELQALIAGDFLVPIDKMEVNEDLQPFPLPSTLPLDLLAHRPDVWARRWRVEASAYKICVAQAAFYPNINITGLTGYQAIRDLPIFAFGSTYGLIFGPALHLPIFEGGLLQADYDARRAEYQAMVADYDSSVITATKEVLNALSIIEKIAQEYVITKGVEAINARNLEYARLKHQRTLVSSIDVLNAENDLLQAKDQRLQAFFAGLQARLLLIRALGGGY